MNLSTFDAISPVDGRYRKSSEPLAAYFSESSLIRYRVKVEAAYFLALCRIPLPQLKNIPNDSIQQLEKLIQDLSVVDIKTVKDIEAVTNHDVKAVEYYIKQNYEAALGDGSEFIHFGLTSQDINNSAIPLAVKESMEEIMLPALNELRSRLVELSEEWRNIPMMAHTHGQPASPTALGKEIAVFIDRLDAQLKLLKNIPWSAKFGGATGNFNAHYAAYPEIDWVNFGNTFVESLGLHRSQITTQIEHYDNLAALFDGIKRINTILIDFCRDM